VIPDTLNHVTQGELQRYENNYKALNLITTALGRNVYDRVAHLEMAHDVCLSCATPIRALLRLSLHVEILIIGSTRLFLRNLVNHLMIALLALRPLSITYVLVVLLLILTMNMLNIFSMCLMILFGK
jgi:hypothetical protein